MFEAQIILLLLMFTYFGGMFLGWQIKKRIDEDGE